MPRGPHGRHDRSASPPRAKRSLRARLEEAEATLEAIRAGRVDALVVHGDAGDQVFTLRGADHRYRLLVETMHEGAATVGADGTVVYCNAYLARLLGHDVAQVIGRALPDFVPPAWSEVLEALLRQSATRAAVAELELVRAGEGVVPVFVSATADAQDELAGGVCLTVTDLTEQKRSEEIVAAERLARSILEQASDAIVVCDPGGRVVRASDGALALAGANPLLRSFAAAFPLVTCAEDESARPAAAELLRAALAGEALRGVEVALPDPREPHATRSLLLAGAPLHNAQGQLLGCVFTLTDITARRHAEAARTDLLRREQRAREHAEEANRLKDEFLATVSHELRTPLNAILGWSRMLRTGAMPAHSRERALLAVERNARVQAQLVEDLLDVGRIVSGKMRLSLGTLDLARVVEAGVDAVRPAAEAKGVALAVRLPVGEAWISGDADRLQQVTWNLLHNAVKFTPPGGVVTVSLARVGHLVQLCVQDTGRGIEPAFLPFVFDRFRQGEAALSRTHAGLGLGLAIVKHLVELHGGTVDARSDGEGRGARFLVALPAEERGGAATPEAAQPLHGVEASPAIAGLQVLVVDDETDSRELLTHVLEHFRARVLVAAGAAEGFDVLRAVRPDVLVSDIGMAGEDGYALIRRVRALPPELGGATPAVALTAFARVEDRTRALAAGFNLHVPKPVDPAELVVVVAALAGKITPN